MPSIALLLCTAFVLVLLRLERRASCGVSPAVWIPTLWTMITASRPLSTWFVGTGNSALASNDSGSPLDRWVLTGLTVAALLVLAQRRFDAASTLRKHRWLIVLLAYMFLSTLWSDITL